MNYLYTFARAAALACGLLLAACGGGGTTVPTIPTLPTLPTLPTTSTLTVTVIDRDTLAPVTTAMVVIDSTGTPAAVDASGKVTITGFAAGPHDIHVFANGYVWTSALQIDPATTSAITAALKPLTAPASEVVFEGGLKNALIDATHTTIAYFIVNGKTYQCTGSGVATGTNDANGNPNYQWTFSLPFAVGASLTGTLEVAEVTIASATSNYTSDYVAMGSQTVTTVATGGGAAAPAAVTGAPVTLSAIKPATATLATIASVTPPAAMTVNGASASVHPGSTGLGGAGLSGNFATQVASYTGYDYTAGAQVFVGETSVGTSTSWLNFSKVAVGSTINPSAQITALPAPTAGQIGAAISWAQAGGTFTAQELDIYDQTTNTPVWIMIAPLGTSGVTLPAAPAGTGTNVATGTTYNLLMSAYNTPTLTYAQLLATPGFGLPGDLANDAEAFSAIAPQTTWTR